jgi:DNA-binding transcriptional LysR family regulator
MSTDVAVTPAGQRLLPETESIIDLQQQAQGDARGRASLREGVM